MPELNERLSGWDAMHSCFCGRWSKSPKRDRDTYERPGEGKWARIFADLENVTACEVCGYDLTRTPLENLKALTAKDWSGSLIKGSCFYADDHIALDWNALKEASRIIKEQRKRIEELSLLLGERDKGPGEVRA